MKYSVRLHALAVCIGLAWGPSASAHSASDAYLILDVATPQGTSARTLTGHGQWDIALRDLDFALSLDVNGDGNISWGEVAARRTDIERYAFANLQLSRGTQRCVIRPTQQLVDGHADGSYAALLFDFSCPAVAGELQLDYHLFFAIDPSHRGIVTVRAGTNVATAVLAPDRARIALAL